MYPLKFGNLYYEKIWGGRKLLDYRENLPQGDIGESWEVACHKNGMSVIINGKYKGQTLIHVINQVGNLIIGDKVIKEGFSASDFPLLIKVINSNENLSVQVHPGDEYAHEIEGDNGKREVWYIIDCEEDSEIIVGTKDCTEEEFRRDCINGTVENYMNKVSVKSGDLIVIEPGLIHSIGKGILLAEVQQNSDTTYRVYDYKRGRELHIDKAIDVLNFDLKPNIIPIDENKKVQRCITSSGFNIDIYNINGSYSEESSRDKFYIFTCVSGAGKIRFIDAGIRGEVTISQLESILIPAYLGRYILSGRMKLIKSYV
ncbi:MAG: type I phosphomannose isomerase catalytic subunit [Clostridium sp.]|uniref:type I phosphomannose isomerase catalytic subunit n=1 Tax=Clostridium sp. TaxID=1506 RepID=UPI00306E48B7